MQPQKTLFRILICIFFICFVIIARKYIELRKSQTKEITQKIKPIKERSVVSWVTLYHPTKKECGNNHNITFNGEKGHVGGCAVSQKMLDYYCNIGDTIVIDSGCFKGRYKINDKAGSKGLLINIWKHKDDRLKDCYKTKVIIKNYE